MKSPSLVVLGRSNYLLSQYSLRDTMGFLLHSNSKLQLLGDPMVRNVLAVIAGLIVGMVFNMAIIQLNTQVLYPMPDGLDTNDPDQFNGYLAGLPTLAFVVVVIAHLSQAFFGGWVAARVGKTKPMLLALIVGVLSLIGGIFALTMFEGPNWMIVELPLYLVVAGLAGRMESKRRRQDG